MKREHVYYFDCLRVFAAISVVFMHVAAGPLRGELNAGWHGLNGLTALAFTAVPLFFMMSGYLLLTDEKTADISVLLRKRLPKLALPLASWTVVAVWWDMYLRQSVSLRGLLDGLLASLSSPQAVHFWYMYTLIALYMLSPVLYGGLKALDKKGHTFVVILCLSLSVRAVLQTVLPHKLWQLDILNKLQFFGGHLATFVLGYYLGKTERKLPNWALALLAAGLWAAVAVGTYLKTRSTGAFDQSFQSQSAGFEVLLAACLFLLAKQTLNRPCRVLRRLPVVPLSLGIYMLHNILISVMHYYEIRETGLWDTLYLTAGVFAASYLVIKTLSTVPVLCRLFGGMPWQAACKTCNWVFTFRKKEK